MCELELLTEDIDDLKDSSVPKEFGDISLKAILNGEEKFKSPDKLIRTLDLFFKYDVDVYPQLLNYLIKNYLLKLKHKDLSYPVMEEVKR